MAGSAQKVLAISELFEKVVVQLPMRDMLNTKRVNKEWKAVIETSLPIRKALFLVAGSAEDAAVNSPERLLKYNSVGTRVLDSEEAANVQTIALNPLFLGFGSQYRNWTSYILRPVSQDSVGMSM